MRRAGGFTLIEMVITVALVGLLASAAVPLAELGYRRAKEQELRIALRTIRDALDDYKTASDEGHIANELGASGYPPDLNVLVEGVLDAQSPDRRMIYFLRRLPRDPFFPDDNVPAASTWAERSYDSPPDAPRPGDDVFDVYSMSSESGINGVPYRAW